MAKELVNNDFADITFGRKSVRVYDENYKISHEEMLEMIQEAVTAPSSVNMQPWRFVVVESAEAKAKLQPLIRFNTKQNETSSAMVLIFGDLGKKSITKRWQKVRCRQKSETNSWLPLFLTTRALRKSR